MNTVSGKMRSGFFTLFGAALLLSAAAASAEEEKRLTVTIAPYFWAAGVKLDLAVNDDPILGADASFRDVLDRTDSTFMGYAEVRAERVGGFIDLFYIDLSDGKLVPVGPGGPILGDLAVDTGLELKIFEIGSFYRIPGQSDNRPDVDVLLGLRRISEDVDLSGTLPGPMMTPFSRQIDYSETDVFAGARVNGRFADRWRYKARLDYGWGGSEGTVNAQATVGYSFGETGLFSLDVGYRYFNVDLDRSVQVPLVGTISVDSDVTLSGPIVGFVFEIK